MISGQTIAVVIPAFNERILLPRTILSMPHYVDRIVVVDDASTDDTVKVVETLSDPRVSLCKHENNRGVGAAIVTGYRWCVEHQVDLAVVVGADNQMDPDDMNSILLPALSGEADYVMGDRLSWPGGWKLFPPIRLVGVLGLAAMTRVATGFPVRDAQCGYTAVTRRALEALPLSELYPRYGFPNDMLAKVCAAGLRTTTRPVRPVYADERSHLRIRKVVAPLLKITARNWVHRVTQPPPNETIKNHRWPRPQRWRRPS